MAQLSTKIKLYCEANSKVPKFDTGGNVEIINNSDGVGDLIKTWNVDGLEKPTTEQLNALETQANTYEQNLITNRTSIIASAKTKLKALGLTEEEVKETFGI